jgi:flagellar basal body rod protein FlgG
VLGSLRLVDFADKQALERSAETLFMNRTGQRATTPEASSVKGRVLELPAEKGVAGLVGLIAANREFESAQRVISTLNKSYEKLVGRG